VSIDLKAFNALCKETWEQRIHAEKLAAEVKEENKKLEEMKAKVLAYMEEAGIENHKVPGFGLLYEKVDFSVRIPQGDEKQKFFNYLKRKGHFETLATVNHATLNSWYKEQMELAINEGKKDFIVPGIEEPKHRKSLVMKRGK